MTDNKNTPLRLTQLAHGGGCGCKIAPGVLEQILTKTAPPFMPPQLLVGIETADDAAVWQINDTQAIVATTDFFMPVVDDPYHFGQIAATNAISDIYAMGGTPLFALAIVGMPVAKLDTATIKKILDGGESICAKARIPIAGGHTIDSLEPIYGLVAIGLVRPDHVKRNIGAKPGDKLILGKGLGVGIYSAAFKKGELTEHDYDAMIASTTQLNTPGPALACLDGVHAVTDVTGFGLAGHLLEICKASRVAANLDFNALPLLPNVLDYARAGHITGASTRNLQSYGTLLTLADRLGEPERMLLADPQTSGGLLVSCSPETVTEVLSIFLQQGFERASVVGEVIEGLPGVVVG
ncbi:MAG: selenide, water dikinase [Pseudomonadota bacterium]|nr:selenide, water dikinase [Pseudomonadota bacterium]MDQ5903170.1 selenide, water dikinase [Pseudomonadota bacterium]